MEPVDRPQQYWNQQTINLANRLLPKVLEGKNKAEIAAYLDDPNNLSLVDRLKQFCNQTYYCMNYRQLNITYCCYQVIWENVGDVKHIGKRDMWNLNYLMFTNPKALDSSNFIFAVLYVVNENIKNYFRQTMTSQGLSYCRYSGNSYPPFGRPGTFNFE